MSSDSCVCRLCTSVCAYQLVDVDTGMPVKVGQVGEYLIDGPQKMLGYLNDEKATNETIDSDGWLHTGQSTEVFCLVEHWIFFYVTFF